MSKTKAPAKKAAPKAKAKPAKKSEPSKNGKLSAIDAAAKVLGEYKEPMNTRGMIEAMAKKGYWTSPGGATPWATLYSAILSEITQRVRGARAERTPRRTRARVSVPCSETLGLAATPCQKSG